MDRRADFKKGGGDDLANPPPCATGNPVPFVAMLMSLTWYDNTRTIDSLATDVLIWR